MNLLRHFLPRKEAELFKKITDETLYELPLFSFISSQLAELLKTWPFLKR